MRASTTLFFGIGLLAAASAFGQSNPYAGAWAGTLNFHGTSSCTCSGASCPAGPLPGATCDSPYSWTATIDPQGEMRLVSGPGITTCTSPDGNSNSFATGQLSFGGQVSPATGSVSFAASTNSTGTTTQSCQAFSLQFSLAPRGVAGTSPCTQTAVTSAAPGQTLTCTSSWVNTFNGTQTSAPVFAMTVDTNITATTANATAQVQPPAQLVGTTASVFVFAHARQSLLGPKRAASRAPVASKDGEAPDPCVLAQLNPNGQLASASASSLQPAATGILASQSQSITVLNNVATPNVAGASFYVGYGTSSDAMLSSGLYQGAVTVDGSNACSAALLAGAAPKSPGALSGLWWNPAESGWGISFTQRAGNVFAAWYTYDASGSPKWYVASNCTGASGATGICTGSLFEVSGPSFFGTTFNPALVASAAVGTLRVSFQDANNASLNYTLNGQTRIVPITRQPLQSGTIPPAVDYTDLWWNPAESGWGMTVTHQYGTMFLAWYVYSAAGKPVWYVATCAVVGSGCTGPLYSTTGPAFGPTFDPSAVRANAAGTVTLNFTDANNATINYTVNGVASAKTITRQLF